MSAKAVDEEGRCRRAVETGRLRQIGEHGEVADVAAVQEIRLEQRLGDGVVALERLGVADEPVRVHRVRRHADPIETEVDALDRADLADRGVQALRLRGVAELHGEVALALHAVGRHGGVELEGAPADGRAQGRARRQRALQAPLADEAPWTNGI